MLTVSCDQLQRKKLMECAPRRTSGRVQKMREKKEENRSPHSPAHKDASNHDVEEMNRQLDERLRGVLMASLELTSTNPKQQLAIAPITHDSALCEPRNYVYESLTDIAMNGTDCLRELSVSLPTPPPQGSPPHTTVVAMAPLPIHPPPLSSTLRLATPPPSTTTTIDEYDIDNVELDKVQNFKHSYISSRSHKKGSNLSYRRSSSTSSTTDNTSPSGAASSSLDPYSLDDDPPVSSATPIRNHKAIPQTSSSSNSKCKKNSCNTSNNGDPYYVNNIISPVSSVGKHNSCAEELRSNDAKKTEHEGKKRKRRPHAPPSKAEPINKKCKQPSAEDSPRKKKETSSSNLYIDMEDDEEQEELYKPRLGRSVFNYSDLFLIVLCIRYISMNPILIFMPYILIIKIIYHDFLPPPRRGSHVK